MPEMALAFAGLERNGYILIALYCHFIPGWHVFEAFSVVEMWQQ